MRITGYHWVAILVIVIVSQFCAAISGAAPTPVTEIEQTLTEYHDALKNGDIGKMLRHLGGDFFARYKNMVQQDPNYSEFLKRYYKGSSLHINNAHVAGTKAEIEVQIRFPNGNNSTAHFFLNQSADRQWLITGQRLN